MNGENRMDRIELIGNIKINSSLMTVMEEYSISALEIEDIDRSEYLSIANMIFTTDDRTSEELVDMVEYWIELCIEDIIQEDEYLLNRYYTDPKKVVNWMRTR